MISDNSSPSTGACGTFDSIQGQSSINMPTSSQDKTPDGTTNPDSSPTPPVEGQVSAGGAAVSIGFTDEIEALKTKISELEGHVKRVSPATTFQDSEGVTRHLPDSDQGTTHPSFMADVEHYQRMEECLYRHRKEWETNGMGKTLSMFTAYDKIRWGLDERNFGPWNYRWVERPEPEYKRPNPFDPSHNCIHVPGETSEMDEFDHAIDYGAARDRLRKNFEWDMDRMFLAEEMEVRKRHKKEGKQENLSMEKAEMDKKAANKDSEPRACAKLELNRLDWLAFRRLSRSEESHSCVVDILIGEPILNDDSGRSNHPYLGRRVAKVGKLQQSEAPTSKLGPQEGPLPERIRIHSTALRGILTRLDPRGALVVENFPSFVLLRPFKTLFHHEQALISWCTGLEQQLESSSKNTEPEPATCTTTGSEQEHQSGHSHNSPEMDNVSPKLTDASLHAAPVEVKEDAAVGKQHKGHEIRADSEDTDTSEGEEEEEEKFDPNDITRSTMALDHLKCLLSFIDSYILARQNYLSGQECRKVFFSDLWYLFRPGMEVIGRGGKQAYRVIHVTSPRHRVVPAWQTWLWGSGDKKKKAPFSITCVYIDFDGNRIGPVSKRFDFKGFDGEMDVTSLPVYPLRLHPMTKKDFSESEWLDLDTYPPESRYRQKLINRGSRFLNVAEIKPMYYAGPTLEIHDEVESQVVIDFETAFSMDNDRQQAWKPTLEIMLGNSVPKSPDKTDRNSDNEDESEDENEDIECRADCCRGDVIGNDAHIDNLQRQDYVNGLLPKTGGPSEQPSIAIIPRPLEELRNGPEKNSYAISDDERVIMSYRVFGFILRSRQWAQLDLSYLTDLHPPNVSSQPSNNDKGPQDNMKEQQLETAFDRLVLEKGQKPMIQALVAQHFRDKESQTGQMEQVDIVKGKGKGLILLLHGAPGVGKTSTAEGVAESFKKPLFQITCGDLGTTAKEVEKALEINFTLANKWDCVLLLDEADVFLAQRNKEDFQRNGLVAVFLRVLEYYAGVLFLTTNRVGDFDEAFTSRIHVSLYYPVLDKDKTLQVFNINTKMIKERFDRKKRTIVIDDVEKFASDYYDEHPQTRWNGRQIRNACQTALALAEFEAQGSSHQAVLKPNAPVHLQVSHFEVVQKAYLHFAEYMNSIYGSSSSTRAKEGRVRAIWIDEDDRVVATQGMGGRFKSRKENFLVASQGQPQPQHVQPQQPPQQVYQQQVPIQPPQGYQQQVFPMASQGVPNLSVPQHYQYSPQPMYTQAPSQMQMQVPQVTANQPWHNPAVNVGGPAGGQGEGQNRVSPQPTGSTFPQSQPSQQQLPTSPPGFEQNIQGVYAAGSPQGGGQGQSNNLPSAGAGGYPPGHSQWQGS